MRRWAGRMGTGRELQRSRLKLIFGCCLVPLVGKPGLRHRWLQQSITTTGTGAEGVLGWPESIDFQGPFFVCFCFPFFAQSTSCSCSRPAAADERAGRRMQWEQAWKAAQWLARSAGVTTRTNGRQNFRLCSLTLLPTTAQRCGADRCGRAGAVTVLAMGWE